MSCRVALTLLVKGLSSRRFAPEARRRRYSKNLRRAAASALTQLCPIRFYDRALGNISPRWAFFWRIDPLMHGFYCQPMKNYVAPLLT